MTLSNHNESSNGKTVKILYFASLGERLDCEEEWLTLNDDVQTVADIKQQLSARGGSWPNLITDTSIRTAVDQTIARDDTAVAGAKEIAFFPPVTGG